MEHGTDSKLMWLEILRLANAQCNDYEFCCMGSRLWHLKRAAGELWLMLDSGPPEGLVDLPYLAHSDFCGLVKDVDGEFDKDDCGWPVD